jgi:hypothetical protein
METSGQRCDAMLAKLDVPTPFDVETFCNSLERTHGFRVTLVPVRNGISQPCGLRAHLDGVHHIFHDYADSADRRDHAALHVIAHLLLGHTAAPVITDAFTARVMPDLDPAMVRRVLGHGTYTKAEEAEADLLARLIVEAGRPAGEAIVPAQRTAKSTVDGR